MFKTYTHPKGHSGLPAEYNNARVGTTIGRSNNASRETTEFYKTVLGEFSLDRYNPVFDPLQSGSVIEDWIPRDLPGIHLLMRRIYTRDDVGGPMVDIYKEMMWSAYDLEMEDGNMLTPFADSLHNLDIENLMPAITGEHLIIGRSINGLAFDGSNGIFRHCIPHNPDFCRLKPVPIFGYDPLVDLQSTQSFREFTNSRDPRILDIQSSIPAGALSAMEENQGWTPLDPMTTMITRRQSSPYDHIGTSIFSRLLNFWAIQKALIDATAISLRRRAAGVLHVRVGNEKWHPSDSQMRDIAGLFMQAEEDLGGGIVVTRDGVEADRSQSAVGDLWKFSDEYPFLSEGKMRAIGISDAFLSGDATYNNMEMALSSFLERMRGGREHITNQIIVRKIFFTLARVHGFIKPENNSPQGRRNAWVLPTRRAMDIPTNRLIVPKMVWRKSLFPDVDEVKLGILERMLELGMPVTKRAIAAAGGMDIDRALGMLDEDVEIDKKIKKWKEQIEGDVGSENGDGSTADRGIFGRVRVVHHPLQKVKKASVLKKAVPEAITSLPIWDRQNTFMGLKQNVANKSAIACLPLLNSDSFPSPKAVMERSGLTSSNDRLAFRYILARIGMMPGFPVSSDKFANIAKHIVSACPNPVIANHEIETLTRACYYSSNAHTDATSTPNVRARQKPKGPETVTRMPNGPDGADLISGVISSKV